MGENCPVCDEPFAEGEGYCLVGGGIKIHSDCDQSDTERSIERRVTAARLSAYRECTKIVNMPMAQILQQGGEMTAQEKRTLQAFQKMITAAIDKLFMMHGPHCASCTRKMGPADDWDLDHVLALENGGTDDDSNFQVLCETCHEAKTGDDHALAGHGRKLLRSWSE